MPSNITVAKVCSGHLLEVYGTSLKNRNGTIEIKHLRK